MSFDSIPYFARLCVQSERELMVLLSLGSFSDPNPIDNNNNNNKRIAYSSRNSTLDTLKRNVEDT